MEVLNFFNMKNGQITNALHSESAEKPLTQKGQKKVQTAALKELKESGGRENWNAVQHLAKKYGGQFSGVEVLAFHDEDHAKRAFAGKDPFGESLFGDLRSWDEVKDQIKPGMSLEFRLRADTEGLKTHKLAEGMSEEKADKYIEKYEYLMDPQIHMMTVPGKAKVEQVGVSEYKTPPGTQGKIGHERGDARRAQFTVTGKDGSVTHVTADTEQEARGIAEHYQKWLGKNAPTQVPEKVSGKRSQTEREKNKAAAVKAKAEKQAKKESQMGFGFPTSVEGPKKPLITPAEVEKPPAPVKKEEKGVVEVQKNLHSLPDHRDEVDEGDKERWKDGEASWSLDPGSYRKKVNAFYRGNKTEESIYATAKQALNRLQATIKRSKNDETIASLKQEKKDVERQRDDDIKTVTARRDSKAIAAEHKKIIEDVLEEIARGGKDSDRKQSLLNRAAIEAYGIKKPPPRQSDLLREQKDIEDLTSEELQHINDTYKDFDKSKERKRHTAVQKLGFKDWSDFKFRFNEKEKEKESDRAYKALEKHGFSSKEIQYLKDLRKKYSQDPRATYEDIKVGMGTPGDPGETVQGVVPEPPEDIEGESINQLWGREPAMKGAERGYTALENKSKAALKFWVDGVRESIRSRREDFLRKHKIDKTAPRESLTDDQIKLISETGKAEQAAKERLVSELKRRWESADISEEPGATPADRKLISGLSKEGQQEIIEYLRKSVNTEEPLPVDTLMSGLFLNIALFKALTVSEKQKIQAFKNSFGAGTSGVGPATMNTVGIGERDKDKDKDEDDDDKTKKSLNLGFYIRC